MPLLSHQPSILFKFLITLLLHLLSGRHLCCLFGLLLLFLNQKKCLYKSNCLRKNLLVNYGPSKIKKITQKKKKKLSKKIKFERRNILFFYK